MNLPSFMAPWASIACPTGKTVFTKIPIEPLGESIPPTTLKPNPFLPGPFSNSVVCSAIDKDLGRCVDVLTLLELDLSAGIIVRPCGFEDCADETPYCCCCCLRSTPRRTVEFAEVPDPFPPR